MRDTPQTTGTGEELRGKVIWLGLHGEGAPVYSSCHQNGSYQFGSCGLYQIGTTMNNQIPDLIARASKVAGNDSALARSMGVPPSMVSMWKLGTKTCPPEDQASMAAIAGLDPVQVLVRAHLERHEGTAKGDRLMKVLGKSLLATGAAIGSAGASAHQIFLMVEGLPPVGQWMAYFIQCILC